MPLTGPRAQEGREIADAVELHARQVNGTGGIGGRRVRIVRYDDEARPEVAATRAREIVASQAVGVIGHITSAAALAAGPAYDAAGIPVVTANAGADEITEGKPGSFRLTFDVTSQSRALTLYAQRVLGTKSMTVIVNPTPAGARPIFGIENAFQEAGGTLRRLWQLDAKMPPQALSSSLDQIADDLKGAGTDDLVYLGIVPSSFARDIIVGLRRRGAKPLLLGTSSYGADSFAALFADLDEERHQPGFFTDGLLAAAPVLLDSANDRAQVFADEYRRDPLWFPWTGYATFSACCSAWSGVR